MKQHDDYVSGSHHYWMHFVCGFIFGGGLGGWIAYCISDSGLIILIAAVVTAVTFAFSCGRWGDRSWRTISDWLRTLWVR
jgi:hypothetical protein